jgi:hypothetical protein
MLHMIGIIWHLIKSINYDFLSDFSNIYCNYKEKIKVCATFFRHPYFSLDEINKKSIYVISVRDITIAPAYSTLAGKSTIINIYNSYDTWSPVLHVSIIF